MYKKGLEDFFLLPITSKPFRLQNESRFVIGRFWQQEMFLNTLFIHQPLLKCTADSPFTSHQAKKETRVHGFLFIPNSKSVLPNAAFEIIAVVFLLCVIIWKFTYSRLWQHHKLILQGQYIETYLVVFTVNIMTLTSTVWWEDGTHLVFWRLTSDAARGSSKTSQVFMT